jgi:CheY-like chemotaxis protein
MLIDDDKDECELMEDALRLANIENKLLCFHNGKAAIDYLMNTEEQPFLILSDVNMPEMGGLELRRSILKNDYLRSKAIPFIFYTTSAQKKTIVEAYEMNVQGFFEKPTLIQDLSNLLAEISSYWQKCHHPRN